MNKEEQSSLKGVKHLFDVFKVSFRSYSVDERRFHAELSETRSDVENIKNKHYNQTNIFGKGILKMFAKQKETNNSEFLKQQSSQFLDKYAKIIEEINICISEEEKELMPKPWTFFEKIRNFHVQISDLFLEYGRVNPDFNKDFFNKIYSEIDNYLRFNLSINVIKNKKFDIFEKYQIFYLRQNTRICFC